MNGQWIGTYSGTNTGTLVADLDDVGTSYAGMVFVYDNNSSYPRTAAQVELPKTNPESHCEPRCYTFNGAMGRFCPGRRWLRGFQESEPLSMQIPNGKLLRHGSC
jgi:hypothetical protein